LWTVELPNLDVQSRRLATEILVAIPDVEVRGFST
jgi:hypothetical protein